MDSLLKRKHKASVVTSFSLRRGARSLFAGAHGMSLIELMIALAVVAISMIGFLPMFLTSTLTNNRNSRDTTGTLVAQTFLEHISAQNPTVTNVSINDCAGNVINISTQDGAAPNGSGAPLDANANSPTYGLIDWTQAAVASYSANFTDCDPNGLQATYDVRWNVMTITANTTKLITVSARQIRTPGTGGGLIFSIPVTLRGIGGPNP